MRDITYLCDPRDESLMLMLSDGMLKMPLVSRTVAFAVTIMYIDQKHHKGAVELKRSINKQKTIP